MNNVALDLGFIQIYWYSLFIIFALLVGLAVAYKEIRLRRINEDFFINMIFFTIILSLIGARFYYVLFNLDYYNTHIVEVLEVWNGGLAIHGGILFGVIFILLYTKKFKMSTFKMLDICAPALIIGQAIGRWGNFFNQEAFGNIIDKAKLISLNIPTFIIDGMYIDGAYREPTFLYESLWCIIGFILLLIVRKKKYLKIGQLTGFYLMWYSAGRFVIEAMRSDSLMLGTFKVAQIVSVLLFVFGLFLFLFRLRGSKFDNLYREEVRDETNLQF